jgi:hypothetical protein
MPTPPTCLALLLTLAVTASAQTPAPQQTAPTRASIAGNYDGGQMEVGAQLLLKPDGHFQYELAYGALDESAAGTWDLKDNVVLLTTVPAVVPPHFVVVSDTPDPKAGLWVKFTKILVEGMRQRVILVYVPNKEGDEADVNDDGSVDIPAGKHPVSFIPEIPVYPTLPDPIPLTGPAGHRFLLRFEPHDIGKANFRSTPLAIDNGELVMPRRDLQILLRFKRQPQP